MKRMLLRRTCPNEKLQNEIEYSTSNERLDINLEDNIMSSPITFKVRNSKKTDGFLERLLEKIKMGNLDRYGQMGVEALSNATPVRTGLAASSWYYTIERANGSATLSWHNSDIEGGYNVAILIQYGHGTRNGGYVKGIDYINPALAPVFQQMADEIWEEVRQ